MAFSPLRTFSSTPTLALDRDHTRVGAIYRRQSQLASRCSDKFPNLLVSNLSVRRKQDNYREPLGIKSPSLWRRLSGGIPRFRNQSCPRVQRKTSRVRCSVSAESDDRAEGMLTQQQMKVAGAAALTMILGVANRVLYKMALVPLKTFPFFLAQLATFGYVAVYFFFLSLRYRAGIVTDEMLAIPKRRFVAMGLLEALGLASGMSAAALLPGALIPILSQVFLVWQLALSYWFLGKRYTPRQLAGCLLVLAGVIIVVASGSGAGSALADAGAWPLVLVLSSAFPAGASILKEKVFRDAAKTLKGGNLDLFVVNSFGSTFQALFVFLLLPLLSHLQGIPFHHLPSYLVAGTGCFLGGGNGVTGCEGAPLIPLLYVAANLAFNISALNLLKTSSAIVASLTSTLAVPLTLLCFTFPLPLLGKPAPLPPSFFTGSAVLVAGLALYNLRFGEKKKVDLKSV